MKPFKEAEGVAADLQAAYDYYKAYSSSTAGRFLAAYETAIRIVQSSPYVCRPRPHGWRQMVRSIFEDSRGNLWIGNNGLGVLLYDGQAVSNFTREHGLSIREKGPTGSLGRIFSIAEDAAGNICFGTRDNGAGRFNGKSLTNFTMADGLTSSMVSTIYRDKRDALWFGMSDGSVCRFNGETFDRIH